MIINVERLNKVYSTFEGTEIHALEDISFSVEEGQFVSVVGPSGCGKSTLLKILSGILSKTSGDVILQNTPVDGPRTDIGIVFQAPVLLPWRTVIENVMIPVEVQHQNKKEYYPRARELLKLVGLSDVEGKYPFELSGGMQQRVGIGRALVCDPTILLMDEPFGALDAMTREMMNIELLRIWRESKKTIIFITHSIPESVLLSDRVIVLAPCPGKVIKIVDIDLPRPRHLEMISSQEFGDYASEIRSMIGGVGGID